MSNFHDVLASLRATFKKGQTRPPAWRVEQLRALRGILTDHKEELFKAVWEDLHKSPREAMMTEIGPVVGEIDDAIENLATWTRPQAAQAPITSQPGTAHVVREPFGVALILGAWNYPISLLLAPLVGAIAGGNAAVLKPSELAPATSAAIARLVPRFLDKSAFAVVEGGVPETQALLDQPFDFFFFTGSGRVGQIVLEKAAKNLVPAVLELGGKSPCIVDASADLDVAAQRIIWGKLLNAGQTCVAPDYVLVQASVEEELVKRMTKMVTTLYGDDPKKSPNYGRIVNAKNFDRLARLLESGQIACGGQTDASERYIAPTILRKVSPDAPVMQDEIFGPILPVLALADTNAAIAFVNERPKPLALYLFSESRAVHADVVERTSSGGVAINDVVVHMSSHELPFGGVGASGMGQYHGRWGFETFTHPKAVLARSKYAELRFPAP
jgi:aldehyde dehydrogenase (NAD+)